MTFHPDAKGEELGEAPDEKCLNYAASELESVKALRKEGGKPGSKKMRSDVDTEGVAGVYPPSRSALANPGRAS